MAVTVKVLKEKITRLEQELAEVRQSLEQLAPARPVEAEKSATDAVEWVDKDGWTEWFDEWFRQMDIRSQPIGVEKLQRMMREEGIQPEENLLSRGIIAMRDE